MSDGDRDDLWVDFETEFTPGHISVTNWCQNMGALIVNLEE